ncbi:hypothetical protein BJ912DRAFT_965464 [Pholiota molesta]|nr:hypothetical protein BJ912DRAFT_965464 [Pholiota molesta]
MARALAALTARWAQCGASLISAIVSLHHDSTLGGMTQVFSGVFWYFLQRMRLCARAQCVWTWLGWAWAPRRAFKLLLGLLCIT